MTTARQPASTISPSSCLRRLAALLSSPDMYDLDDGEAGANRAALERTRQIVVLADGSKFGDVALSTVAPIKDVSVIVTDASADPAELELIERVGVEVIKIHPEVTVCP
jgi:DeoR/GlpR family transcriptional regulator of sugar metabolism